MIGERGLVGVNLAENHSFPNRVERSLSLRPHLIALAPCIVGLIQESSFTEIHTMTC